LHTSWALVSTGGVMQLNQEFSTIRDFMTTPLKQFTTLDTKAGGLNQALNAISSL
jgi:hypothetical protein